MGGAQESTGRRAPRQGVGICPRGDSSFHSWAAHQGEESDSDSELTHDHSVLEAFHISLAHLQPRHQEGGKGCARGQSKQPALTVGSWGQVRTLEHTVWLLGAWAPPGPTGGIHSAFWVLAIPWCVASGWGGGGGAVESTSVVKTQTTRVTNVTGPPGWHQVSEVT